VTTLEEALYLAKLANIWTEAEVQYQIVRGPEFSRDNSPFMLENFFEVQDEPYEAAASKEQLDIGVAEGEREWPNTNPTVHATIEKYFRPDLPPKFWHGGKEWLSYVEGCGHCFLRVVQPVGFGELLPSSLGPQRGLDTRKVWGLSTTADLDLQ